MTATKKSIHDVDFDVGVRAFTYTITIEHLDWDLAFLGAELNAQMVVWRDQWRASFPPSDEPPSSPSAKVPAPPSGEVPEISPPFEV